MEDHSDSDSDNDGHEAEGNKNDANLHSSANYSDSGESSTEFSRMDGATLDDTGPTADIEYADDLPSLTV